MKRILKDNFYKMLPEYGLTKESLLDFRPHTDMAGIALFHKEHELEFGFFDDALLEQKALFYEISSKYASVIKAFLEKHEENFIVAAICEECLTDGDWYTNRKNYDCCHNYAEYFFPNRIYMLDVSAELDCVDYVLENVLRGFYDVQILLPNTKIIIDINVHCSLGWFGEHVHDYYESLWAIVDQREMAEFALEKRNECIFDINVLQKLNIEFDAKKSLTENLYDSQNLLYLDLYPERINDKEKWEQLRCYYSDVLDGNKAIEEFEINETKLHQIIKQLCLHDAVYVGIYSSFGELDELDDVVANMALFGECIGALEQFRRRSKHPQGGMLTLVNDLDILNAICYLGTRIDLADVFLFFDKMKLAIYIHETSAYCSTPLMKTRTFLNQVATENGMYLWEFEHD